MNDRAISRPGFYGWTNVILLFVIYMAAFGMVYYGFSVIFPMMIKTLEWNRGTASIAHTINAVLMGLVSPAVAYSISRIGCKKTLMFGFSLLLVALLLMGSVMTQMWQWVVLWGIVVSIGFVFGGALPLQTILMFWFNIKRATAMGIVMTGAAIGGFVAQPFYSWLMRETGTWRSGWFCAAIFVLIGLVCTLFVINKPQDIGQHMDGLSPEDLEKAALKGKKKSNIFKTADVWGVKEALKNRVMLVYIVIVTGHLMALTFIATHGILNFLDRGFSEMQAPVIFSMVLLGSACIRFPIGMLGDKIEPRRIIIASFGIMMVMIFFIWKNQSLTMLMVACFLFGACYGTQLIMFPTLMGNYFGPQAFAGIGGMLAPLFVVCGAVVPVGGGYIFEATGSYNAAYLFLVCLLVVAFFVSFLLKPPVKKAAV